MTTATPTLAPENIAARTQALRDTGRAKWIRQYRRAIATAVSTGKPPSALDHAARMLSLPDEEVQADIIAAQSHAARSKKVGEWNQDEFDAAVAQNAAATAQLRQEMAALAQRADQLYMEAEWLHQRANQHDMEIGYVRRIEREHPRLWDPSPPAPPVPEKAPEPPAYTGPKGPPLVADLLAMDPPPGHARFGAEDDAPCEAQPAEDQESLPFDASPDDDDDGD